MDFTDVLRELGFDGLAGSSGGGSRGPAPADGGDGATPEAEAADADGDAAVEGEDGPPAEGVPAPEPESEPEPTSSGGRRGGLMGFGGGGGDDEVAEAVSENADRLDDVEHELGQQEADIESNTSRLEAFGSQREELVERLDQIEEHNATLLGIYDRLTDEINPFAADWDRESEPINAGGSDMPYNVVQPSQESAAGAAGDTGVAQDADGEATAAAETEATPGEEGTTADGAASSDDGTTAAEDGTVSFEDLRGRDGADDAAEAGNGEAAGAVAGEEFDTVGGDPTNGDAGDSADLGDSTSPSPSAGVAPGIEDRDRLEGPYLNSLGSTYATDVLIMEWLSMLLEVGGPAGTLAALEYYDRINWISSSVRLYLEDALSGVAHDATGPPASSPDLPPEVHNRSFAHVMELATHTDAGASAGHPA